MSRTFWLASLAAAWLALPAAAGIVEVQVTRTESFAGGAAQGTRGAYVKVVGVAKGELDPRLAVNRVIANIDRAPRNARGMVEYDVDFYIMRPVEIAKGNGAILYDVTNRGRKFLLPWMQDARQTSPGGLNEPTAAEHAGNGFAFREGYAVVWSGWDPDAPRANGGMTIRVPIATDGGRPIVQRIRDEFVFGTRVSGDGSRAALSYPATSLDPTQARLTVRAREQDAPQEVAWEYVDANTIRLLPASERFKPGYIYDFRYAAKDPKVLGIGYAATRDLVSFLKYEPRDRAGHRNPLAAEDGALAARRALAVGISQSGRYLRDHVSQGFNQDEARRKVFDGVLAHISGIGRVFMNEPFAQPNRTNTQHEDHLFPENAFPFAHGAMDDPITGRRGALLRGDGFDPLVMEVNTSTEYWQKGASLLATDPLGRRDVAMPPGVRLYMVAGTQHGGRAHLGTAAGTCVNPRNPHSPAPLLRALTVALDDWVRAGISPPASRIPRLAESALVAPERIAFPAIPGAQIANGGNSLCLFGEWTDPQVRRDKCYVPLVSSVDADGNEAAGVRLPDIAVPVATYTGWNLYRAPYPEGELCDREGSYFAFAKTRAEREANRDPRPSLAERYASHADYVRRVAETAQQLVRDRLLLAADAAAFVSRAEREGPLK